MSDPEKKICRYFNTLGGCWYGDTCKFLHIPNKKPPCKFYGSSTGCRYGESCHFSHDRAPFKSVENYNSQADVIKEVFKENVDPAELSGTNNNNMTQSMSALMNAVQEGSVSDNGKPTMPIAGSDTMHSDNGGPSEVTDLMESHTPPLNLYPTTVEQSIQRSTENDGLEQLNLTASMRNQIVGMPPNESMTSQEPMHSSFSTPLTATHNATPTGYIAAGKNDPEIAYRDDSGSVNMLMADDGQNYQINSVNGRTNGMTNEIEIFCGSCKRVLERRGNESYCTLLKDHYLECFLDKEGDHVKYVKSKAALEPGQMYWCKSCILIFEKPWSLFQHMADKAKGCKVQRWEKKIHLDWMDNVAGLMAGYDLGLFSPAKLRIDLRNLLADQHTMEEEMEVAAVTAAAMMQWLTPLSNPWRLQQREMMRKIEQLNRQMLRKANLGLNAVGGGYPMRAALNAAPVSTPTSSFATNYVPASRSNVGSLPVTPAPQRYNETHLLETGVEEAQPKGEFDEANHSNVPPTSDTDPTEREDQPDANLESNLDSTLVGPLGDGSTSAMSSEAQTHVDNKCLGASGDAAGYLPNRSATPVSPSEINESGKQPDIVDTNNTNSATVKAIGASNRGDEVGRKADFKRGYHSAPSYGYGNSKSTYYSGLSSTYRGFGETARCQLHPRGSRTPGYTHSASHFNPGNRLSAHRVSRTPGGTSGFSGRGANTFNPPSFHASMDFNCGFTDDEVEELLSQGINPWDSEASAALAVLRGELDHLLD